MKNFLVVLIASVLIISCKKEIKKQANLLDFIPNNPTAVIYSNSISELQNQFSENEFLSNFEHTETYSSIKKEYQFLSNITSDNNVIISYATVGKSQEYLLAIKTTNTLQKTSDALQYNNISYFKLKNQDAYSLTIDSTLVVSSSQILIENLIRNKQDNIRFQNESFKKLYKTNIANTALFLNIEKLPNYVKSILPTSFFNTKDWMVVDFDNENGMMFNGIAKSDLLQNSFANTIKQAKTSKNEVARVLPETVSEYVSYSFENLPHTSSQFEHFEALLQLTEEVASFKLNDHKLVAFKLMDTAIAENLTAETTYRNVNIYQNSYYKIPASIIVGQPEYACFLNDFLLMSSSKETLETCIAHYQNKTTLAQQPYYQNTKEELVRAAHIEIGKKTKTIITQLSKQLHDKSIQKVTLRKYPLFVHQITYDEGYAQLRSVLLKTSKTNNTKGITQIADLRLKADLATQPQWVVNHKNKQKELIVQDENNVLYLFSNTGKLLWTKPLQSKIQGKIHQVDLYRNRKLQLAFTTQNEFMVLDRNGNLVEPFYKKFKDGNLLPLAVFDYDHNRKYRFVLTQGNEVFLFDNKMKPIKGFKFSKTKKAIFQTPKHMRIGTKDYIIIADKSGTIHIVNRQGKDRTKVATQFKMSTIPLQFTKKSIVLVDADKTVQQIDVETGDIKKIDALVTNDSDYVINHTVKVKKENQNLIINNRTVDLEYGTYTHPKIEYANRKYYVSVTDIDTQKVYVYDTKGKLQPHFPIYGKSAIALTTHNKKVLLSVQGEDNSVLIYQINQ